MLNWKVRYAKLIRQCPELRNPDRSVLEIGCGPSGIANLLQRPVQGVELNPVPPQTEWLKVDQGNILDLPYPDNSFDFVVCVDVIEHLLLADRPKAIAELARVAKGQAIISCPYDYPGMDGELALADWLDRRFHARPDWLNEHFQLGLPKVGEMLSAVAALGLPFDFFGNEGMLQHYGALMLDLDFSFSAALESNHQFKTPCEEPLVASEWDMVYSYGICIHKQAPMIPAYRDMLSPNANKARESRVGTYAALHNRALLADFGPVAPIFTGEAANQVDASWLTDILSSGERLKNNRWSEMSALYKVWREGPVTEVVGFFHYRRFFDFSIPGNQEYRTVISPAEVAACNKNFLHDGLHGDCLNGTVIIPFPTPLKYTPFNHYATYHNAHDLCKIITLIAKKAPELLPYTGNLFNGDSLYSHNMFIMGWDLFDQLCKVWFGLLLDFEAMVAADRANSYQNRDISFLAERVFDIWIRYAADHLSARLVSTTMYFVEH